MDLNHIFKLASFSSYNDLKFDLGPKYYLKSNLIVLQFKSAVWNKIR